MKSLLRLCVFIASDNRAGSLEMPDQDAVGLHTAAFGLVDVHHAYNVGGE